MCTILSPTKCTTGKNRDDDNRSSTSDHDYIYKDGIVFIAIDNFPTEFPKEATKYFGDSLLPFLEPILKSDPSKPFAEQNDLPVEIYPHDQASRDLRSSFI